ncbi:VanZ family protein [Alkalicoccobacillus murimartini]|uniref:Glycopeptide antibiotics resistance protein n=1 Tax=Alkalicoccobacillus murimartini TaxID=171685 RepID=A0ABT9YL00_9BACI|nr:VanZ family protein [Alkalicoccobacillus murimartini]MDQ0208421.1 glycopeptide antibiotics resistance protein [Alkalicoccobacillus murimartini]
MTAETVLSIIRDHFTTALFFIIMLALLFFILYFLVYKKLLRGTTNLPIKVTIVSFVLIGYLIMVSGVTIFNRGAQFEAMDLTLFGSYIEAWNNFSVRNWQYVILNIVMFLPLGILLPLLHDRFKNAVWTIAAGILLTLSIETFQYFTGFGVFEFDDLFNNTLGAIIGYGLTMSVMKLWNKRFLQAVGYLTPLLLTSLAFGIIFVTYSLKEFGNLSIVPNKKVDMIETTVILDVMLEGENHLPVPVYKVTPYSEQEAREFVESFFEQMDIDTSDIDVNRDAETGFFSVQGEPSYSLWFEFKDGSYTLNNYFFEENIQPLDTDESNLLNELNRFGITLPDAAELNHLGMGEYEWRTHLYKTGDQLIDGTLSVEYFSDDTIKSIVQSIITYDKVTDKPIKTKQQAFNQLMDGSFDWAYGDINKIEVKDVELTYFLDSKGFYQPVYSFTSIIDGSDEKILIPAI